MKKAQRVCENPYCQELIGADDDNNQRTMCKKCRFIYRRGYQAGYNTRVKKK